MLDDCPTDIIKCITNTTQFVFVKTQPGIIYESRESILKPLFSFGGDYNFKSLLILFHRPLKLDFTEGGKWRVSALTLPWNMFLKTH